MSTVIEINKYNGQTTHELRELCLQRQNITLPVFRCVQKRKPRIHPSYTPLKPHKNPKGVSILKKARPTFMK